MQARRLVCRGARSGRAAVPVCTISAAALYGVRCPAACSGAPHCDTLDGPGTWARHSIARYRYMKWVRADVGDRTLAHRHSTYHDGARPGSLAPCWDKATSARTDIVRTSFMAHAGSQNTPERKRFIDHAADDLVRNSSNS